jgi:hypothetical protein
VCADRRRHGRVLGARDLSSAFALVLPPSTPSHWDSRLYPLFLNDDYSARRHVWLTSMRPVVDDAGVTTTEPVPSGAVPHGRNRPAGDVVTS